ncbi:Clavaminate synthase-like protein [Dichomitus squalens]|uniref:Clavaminate synthase-like protein n=1 Tax=Dichomitus squalens TaxID=114155 RepID=A0A4V2K335_9APHY|nr:Clavaminate synthase-like protein [Dichomitus squalens]TBU58437.1 Clavaminate synthase-like protein [Dichomitus squalens]
MIDLEGKLADSFRCKTLKWLSEEYHEMNGTQYDVLDHMPTPLEFSRLVHIARPVLIKESTVPEVDDKCAWSKEWISEKMGNNKISVAVTPNGRADAVTTGPDGKLFFAEPHTQRMTVSSFLDTLSSDTEGHEIDNQSWEVHYLQSQNGNLFSSRYFDMSGEEDPSEFEALREYIPSDVSWCSDALDRTPDAVNLWIGDERSVTSIHSDPYENIYTVIRGAKHFTLLPPTEGWCLKERRYPHGTYARSSSSSALELVPSLPSVPLVRWSSVTDPTAPGALPSEAHPIHVTVKAGETLYLPAGWWHHVRQEGFTVAVNYWYDMEGRGMSWVWMNFLRGTEEPPLGNDEGAGAKAGGQIES